MGQQGGLAGMMLPLAMFAAIFYFLIIRPQKKQQKAKETMLASITRGTTVITAGGFFGVVREILDDSYIIELDENTKVRILKTSVSAIRTGAEASAEPKQQKKLRKVKKVKKTEGSEENAEQHETAEETAVAADDAQQPASEPETRSAEVVQETAADDGDKDEEQK